MALAQFEGESFLASKNIFLTLKKIRVQYLVLRDGTLDLSFF
jgi:hypothetical protein